MPFIDLSWPLAPGIAKIPHAPGVQFRQFSSIAAGDSSNMTEFTIASHIGTHIDAPRHFIEGGKTIDQIELDRFAGPALVVPITREAEQAITAEDLSEADVRPDDIVLLNTGWHRKFTSPDYQRHPYLSEEAARYLVDRRVKMVGIDCVNVEMPIVARPAGHGRPIHLMLLGHDIPIIENLANLDAVTGRRMRLYAFPLSYKGSDGAQARVVAEVGAG